MARLARIILPGMPPWNPEKRRGRRKEKWRTVTVILSERNVAAFDALRKAESIGRPLGNDAFLDRIAEQIGRKRDRRRKKNGALSPN
ncbi:hypothetical protein [Mesorhizobium sp.]|uniref:hypothetical protein n=1 Tax=Mesorhizobium sp. TaxID=1871066 RepID=UPI00257D217C|nr:hypothetical protein [Mesorhizobium sp.]